MSAGTVEPSFAAAVAEVARHPEWLRLAGRTVAVLGAGAEMGPVSTLLGWGARVLAVDLPRPAIWERLLTAARDGAGTLLVRWRGIGGRRAVPRTAARGARWPGGRAPTWSATWRRSPTGWPPPTAGRWCWPTTPTRTGPGTSGWPPRSTR